MKKSVLSVSSIGVVAVLFLLLNSVSSALLSRFSVDLTEEGLYSLSAGTRKIVSSLEEPVVLKFYFSRLESVRDAGVQLYATRVRDLLREYDRVGGEVISLEEYNPQPDSEEEEWAEKYGLKPIGLPTGERLYFGMVAVSASGEERVIPLFNLNRQETLEYDITKNIYSLAKESMPKVAIMTSLPMQGAPAPRMPNGMPSGPAESPWVFVEQLQSLASVEFLDPSVDEIATDVNVLMVLHPKQLSEPSRYAIDQYLMQGGSLILAVDPYAAIDPAGNDPSNPMAAISADRSSELNSLTEKWGLTLEGKSVVADPLLATQVTARRGDAPQAFIVWLSLNRDLATAEDKPLFNTENIITNQLSSVLFAWPGSLQLAETLPEGVEITPLLRTTRASGLFEEPAYKFIAQNPEQLRANFITNGRQHILAALVRGKLKSAFSAKPGGPEGAEPTSSQVGGHIPEGVEPATVLVLADVDFLADDYSAAVQNLMGYRLVTLLNENLVLALNAVELLGGSDDLIELRSRGSFLRPFSRVREIEAAAEKRWKAEEERLQEEVKKASQRLQQLQSVTGDTGQAVFSQALLDEMQALREQRRQSEERLREVRWELRKEKESLGNWLFVLNTFAVPLFLILGGIYVAWRKKTTKA